MALRGGALVAAVGVDEGQRAAGLDSGNVEVAQLLAVELPLGKDQKMALRIFAYFIKIGSFTFVSGWSILAQMEQEFVDKRRWLTKQELLELVAVGKSLPGIMITNITMLFDYQMAGVLGGVLAVHQLGYLGICISNPLAWGVALCYCVFMVTRVLKKESRAA